MSNEHSVRSEQHGAVVTLTLNRPDRLNALDSEMAGTLRDAIEAISNNASARVVVLRGEGRSFCAGGDVAAIHHPVRPRLRGPWRHPPQLRRRRGAPAYDGARFVAVLA